MKQPQGVSNLEIPTRSLYRLGPESFHTTVLYRLDIDGAPIEEYRNSITSHAEGTWAANRLKVGDVILCDQLVGIGMYTFYLIDCTEQPPNKTLMRLIPYRYTSKAVPAQKIDGFNMSDYGKLMLGEEIEMLTTLSEQQIAV